MRDTEPRLSITAETADAYTILPGRTDAGVLLVCDHAANAFPAGLGTLGVPAVELERHIAYDIGAAAVTRALSSKLSAPAVLTHFSRLLIDPNRGLDDPTLIMRLSDGAIIPGNRHLDAQERERRIRLYYAPYHQAIDRTLDACLSMGMPPAILSIHTFTEAWKGVPRPWHAGVLWDRDDRLARPLIAALEAEGDLVVGDNQPYTGRLEGDCMWQHGTMRGIAHAIVEIRQDLVRDAAGQDAWAARLARIMTSLLSDRRLLAGFGIVEKRAANPHMEL
jgi:predicted N-formylglutamate amidohydrolase